MSLFGVTIIQNVIYWSIYFLSSTFLFAYVEKKVNTVILGKHIPAQWFLEESPLMIVIAGSIFGVFLNHLRNKYRITFTINQHLTVGFIILACGLVIFSMASFWLPEQGSELKYWVMFFIAITAVAEAIIVPKGYASIGELVPKSSQALFMGCWSLLPATGALMASYLSGNYLIKVLEQSLSGNDKRVSITYFFLSMMVLVTTYFARIGVNLINKKSWV